MTGDGGEYLRPEDLKELGDDSLPSSQFLDGMNYLRYSLEGGRSDRYLVKLILDVSQKYLQHIFYDDDKNVDAIIEHLIGTLLTSAFRMLFHCLTTLRYAHLKEQKTEA